MHLNNGHLFTALYLSLLPRSLAPTFLRGLLAQFMFYYLSRGRPFFSPCNLTTESSYTHLTWRKMFEIARENVDEHLPKAIRALYVYESRHRAHQDQLTKSGLLQGWNTAESVWNLTARQLVRMHLSQVQPSKYSDPAARNEGESIGAHQEFWSFDRF